MEKSNATKTPARRPWYRLHLSTWLTLPLGLVVAVLVVLPGGMGQYPDPPSWGWMGDDSAIVHGWPLAFLWRTPAGWTGGCAQAAPFLPWRLTDSVREFRLTALVGDLALTGVCLAMFAAIAEWRRRRRQRAVQFTIRELLGCVLVLACVFGWSSHQRAISREVEHRLAANNQLMEAGFVPRLPLWLRAVVGDDRLSSLGFNGPKGTFYLSPGIVPMQDIQYIVERYPRETCVTVGSVIPHDQANALAAIDRLERIRCTFNSRDDLTWLFGRLEGHSHLREIFVEFTDQNDTINDADLALVGKIPHIESLTIGNAAHQLTARGLDELRKCKMLKELALNGATLTDESLATLGNMPQLRRLNLSAPIPTNADISPLCRLRELEELFLYGDDFDDDARKLRSLPNLRRLTILCGPQYRNDGLKMMLDPSPGSAGHNLEQIYLSGDLVDDELISCLTTLPRLHLVSVQWVPRVVRVNGVAQRPKLILTMDKALPGCDIVFLPLNQ